MHMETEALLMFAARREHIAEVIAPALHRGAWVVSDRFTDASFAYQGGGRGLSSAKLEILEKWVQSGLQPDLTFLFDIDTEIAQVRLAGTGADRDRFEVEREDFFRRVRAAYLQRAALNPARFSIIDASMAIEDIKIKLEQTIARFCI
jgi:dTMP kinase